VPVLPDPVFGRQYSLVPVSRFIRWNDGEIYELGAQDMYINELICKTDDEAKAKAMITAHMQRKNPSAPLARAIIHSPTLEMMVMHELDLTQQVHVPTLKNVRRIKVYAADSRGVVWESIDGAEPTRMMEQEGITALCMHNNSMYYGTINGKVHNDSESRPEQYDGMVKNLMESRGKMLVVCHNRADNKMVLYEFGKESQVYSDEIRPVCLHKGNIIKAPKEVREIFSDRSSVYTVTDDGVYISPKGKPPERIALRKGRQYNTAGSALYYIPDEGAGIIALRNGKETQLFRGRTIAAYCIVEDREQILV
jgi:hypothetical protein